jgi:glycerol uptake operon antiterminator
VLPLVENREQFVRVLERFVNPDSVRTPQGQRIPALFLRHCNVFELTGLVERATQLGIAVYLYIDHINGIHADNAAICYVAEVLRVRGILSNNVRLLAYAKSLGLETIQRIFALDSTGLEAALDSVDASRVDLLDISPALVVPSIASTLMSQSCPFIASGLLHTAQHITTVLDAGAAGVVVARDELW